MLSILFGLSSALAWGAADFCGGMASRKAKAYQAVLFGEAVGLVLLIVAALIVGEPPLSFTNWLLCSIAGVMGVLGLLLFFQAMITGQMTITSSVTGLTATILPVIVGSFLEGFPGLLTFSGFGLALVAIWFISRPDGAPADLRLHLKDLTLPLIAGASFGVYLVLIDRASQDLLLWPMMASRTAGTLTMLVYALAGRKPLLPQGKAWPFILLNGLLDISGNSLYIMAAQAGRMDVAAVLVSLYPGSTVLLAWLLLREKIARPQFMGILLALAAIALMTI